MKLFININAELISNQFLNLNDRIGNLYDVGLNVIPDRKWLHCQLVCNVNGVAFQASWYQGKENKRASNRWERNHAKVSEAETKILS